MPIKLNKLMLVDSITIEEQFRDRINGTIIQLDAIVQQQNLMYMAKSVGSKAIFMGSHSGKLTLWDDFDEKITKVEKQLDDLRTKLKYSRWKEKLWRYAYNGDLPNVVKYHKKMEIYEREHLEELNDLVNGEGEDFTGIRVMEFNGNDEEEREADNTGGYMIICDEYKRRYDIGKSIINFLEQ
jgi:hypothetical protein